LDISFQQAGFLVAARHFVGWYFDRLHIKKFFAGPSRFCTYWCFKTCL
jgi:hypothetical protein